LQAKKGKFLKLSSSVILRVAEKVDKLFYFLEKTLQMSPRCADIGVFRPPLPVYNVTAYVSSMTFGICLGDI